MTFFGQDRDLNADEDITIESFRRILHDTGDSTRSSAQERAKHVNYKNMAFKDLIALQEKMVRLFICL